MDEKHTANENEKKTGEMSREEKREDKREEAGEAAGAHRKRRARRRAGARKAALRVIESASALRRPRPEERRARTWRRSRPKRGSGEIAGRCCGICGCGAGTEERDGAGRVMSACAVGAR